MTGNVEEADTRRIHALSLLADWYRKYHGTLTILEAFRNAVKLSDTKLITISDICEIKDRVDESIEYGERFEVITDLQDRLNEFWNQYEEGVISLPSFVARFEDALLQITEGGGD